MSCWKGHSSLCPSWFTESCLFISTPVLCSLDWTEFGTVIYCPSSVQLYSQKHGWFLPTLAQIWGPREYSLGQKEGWTLKNWCFQTVVLKKTLASPLDSREIKPVNPKGNQSWIFIGRTEAEAPIFRPPNVKRGLIGKNLDAEKDQGQEEKEMTDMRWLDGIIASVYMSLSKFQEII